MLHASYLPTLFLSTFYLYVKQLNKNRTKSRFEINDNILQKQIAFYIFSSKTSYRINHQDEKHKSVFLRFTFVDIHMNSMKLLFDI